MFVLTDKEIGSVVSQNVIPSKQHLGGAKPFAFTETGVAILFAEATVANRRYPEQGKEQLNVTVQQYDDKHIEQAEQNETESDD